MPLPARGLGNMDVIEAIYHRRAVREYTSEPVDRETLEFLVDAAIQAPSAVNQQPWSFAVVREQDVLDRISRESKRHMLGTLPAVPASDHFRKLLSDPDFQIFYHAPALIVISAVAASPWAVEDCSLAAENLDAGDPCRRGSAPVGSASPSLGSTRRRGKPHSAFQLHTFRLLRSSSGGQRPRRLLSPARRLRSAGLPSNTLGGGTSMEFNGIAPPGAFCI